MTAGYAANSMARKRNAEKATYARDFDGTPLSSYDTWARARTAEACVSGEHDGCDGLAYDADEHRVIRCLCGHHAANDTDVSNQAMNAGDGNLVSLAGESHLIRGVE